MKCLYLAAAITAQETFESKPNDDKCTVLALSSGDENSVYQAGALYGLLQSQDPSTHQYDFVTGVSGGAVNAVFLARNEKGKEAQAVENMLFFWKVLSDHKMFKGWFGGEAEGLFEKGGLYDPSPMHDFLKD